MLSTPDSLVWTQSPSHLCLLPPSLPTSASQSNSARGVCLPHIWNVQAACRNQNLCLGRVLEAPLSTPTASHLQGVIIPMAIIPSPPEGYLTDGGPSLWERRDHDLSEHMVS